MSSSSDPQVISIFDPDRPIETKAADLLGRSSYADSIAQYIKDVPVENGFTIAIMGEWGSRKTSVLNLTAEALEKDDQGVVTLRFNPWLFGGTSELVARFFGELGAQLGQADSENLKEIAKNLAKLGQSLAPLSPLPGTTSVAFIFDQLIHAWAKSPSLIRQRENLMQLLKKSGVRVVVLIDDIDRLESAEIREMMRLVRLTGDMPNLIFLLAFDRPKVSESLGNRNMEEGSGYLDKIIQIGYTLPSIRFSNLQDVFFRQLDAILQVRKLSPIDQQVWSEVYFGIIRPLIKNLRDVKRYLNSLPVILETVGEEVALADLLGMEAIRVFSPSLFEELRTNSHVLVQSTTVWMSPEARREHLGLLLDRAGDKRQVLDVVLRVLFPSTQSFLSNVSYGTQSEAYWRRERRVASEEVLLVYLEAGLAQDGLPSSTVLEIVEALGDEHRLVVSHARNDSY